MSWCWCSQHWPWDRLAHPGRSGRGNIRVTTSCLRPAGNGSRTVCPRDNLWAEAQTHMFICKTTQRKRAPAESRTFYWNHVFIWCAWFSKTNLTSATIFRLTNQSIVHHLSEIKATVPNWCAFAFQNSQ